MQEALELQRHLGRKPAVAASLLRLGRIALLRGQYRDAIALLEAGTALADELGKTWDAPYRKASLGLAVLATGDVARAAALFEESLAVREAAGYRGSGSYRAGSADALLGLGIVARYREEYPQAWGLLEDSLQSFRAAGDTEGAATALYQLGLVAHTENDLERAAGALRESLTVRQARGDRLGVADCVDAMAALLQRRGALERSAQLVGLAASLREKIAAPRWAIDQVRHDRELAALRATLGEDTFAASYAAGAALTSADLEQTFAVTAADTA
jgi:tetratricopeptide (TPR) repeat protein